MKLRLGNYQKLFRLCIAYQQGRLILMKNDKDDDPIAVDTSMVLSKLKWNPSGTMIAVAGCSL
jgi:WD repeat-containing protein 35